MPRPRRAAAQASSDGDFAKKLAAQFEVEEEAERVAAERVATASKAAKSKIRKAKQKLKRKQSKAAPKAAEAAASSTPKKASAAKSKAKASSTPKKKSKAKAKSTPKTKTRPAPKPKPRTKRAPPKTAASRPKKAAKTAASSSASAAATSAAAAASAGGLVVHFLRHGEVHNPKRVFYGRLRGFHLSAKGFKEVKSAAGAVAAACRAPLTVLHSPQLRTRETAEVMLGALEQASSAARCAAAAGATVTVEPALDEVDCALEGRAAPTGEWGKQIYADASTGASGGGYESFGDVVRRVVALLRRLEAKHRRCAAGTSGLAGDVLCVTHGDVCLVARLWAKHGTATLLARADALRVEGGDNDSDYPGTASLTTLFFPFGGGEPTRREL